LANETCKYYSFFHFLSQFQRRENKHTHSHSRTHKKTVTVCGREREWGRGREGERSFCTLTDLCIVAGLWKWACSFVSWSLAPPLRTKEGMKGLDSDFPCFVYSWKGQIATNNFYLYFYRSSRSHSLEFSSNILILIYYFCINILRPHQVTLAL